MPGPYDADGALVQVATVTGGPYVTVGLVRSYNATHGTTGRIRTKYFGGELNKLGDRTDTYDIAFLLNLDDTSGQNIVRTAVEGGTTVFLQILPNGLGTGKKGYKQEVLPGEYTDSSDAESDGYVEGGFTAESVGALTNVTLA